MDAVKIEELLSARVTHDAKVQLRDGKIAYTCLKYFFTICIQKCCSNQQGKRSMMMFLSYVKMHFFYKYPMELVEYPM